MRLLQILSDDTLRFTEDLYTDLPPYAILSHTWGPDNEEVTYKDFYKNRGEEKQGFKKIKLCQKWTKEHDLHYFWIDTCCIDKRNLAEISEAINSMYRWYEESEVCFAYLADVHHKSRGTLNEKAFRTSRWFTRGWTLQELIAPSFVEFYSSEGYLLGDTQSLKYPIIDATKIPSVVLSGSKGKKLSGCSAEQRISWFTGRQTKRPEDSIYCLLGLLGVSMPLLYGEGVANAARRLGREIDEMKRDESREADSTSGLVKALLSFSIKKPDGQIESPAPGSKTVRPYATQLVVPSSATVGAVRSARSAEELIPRRYERGTPEREQLRREMLEQERLHRTKAEHTADGYYDERLGKWILRYTAQEREKDELKRREMMSKQRRKEESTQSTQPLVVMDRQPAPVPAQRRSSRRSYGHLDGTEYTTVRDYLNSIHTNRNAMPEPDYLNSIHTIHNVLPALVPPRPSAPLSMPMQSDSDREDEPPDRHSPKQESGLTRFIRGESP